MTYAAIATTPATLKLLVPVCLGTQASLWIPESLAGEAATYAPNGLLTHTYTQSLRATLADLWPRHTGLIFGLATGAVVRLIAPLLTDKQTDPAVVTIEGTGQFVISLCGGHQGGADHLARVVALHLQATPILSGGANALNLPGLDVLGRPFGWTQGEGDWTGVSAAIARQAPVQVIQDCGSTLWQDNLPDTHSFQFGWPEHTAEHQEAVPDPAARVWISAIQRRFADQSELPKVQWHPRVLWVGIGCERGTDYGLIAHAIAQVCQAHHLALGAIAGLATIDLKADEPGLLTLCHERNWPLLTYSPDQLSRIPVPTPSEMVANAVGTPSVAEAAALLAAISRSPSQSEPTVDWTATESPEQSRAELVATPEAAATLLRVKKQIIRHPDHTGAVTVAIAEAEQEYLGRTGQLWLVGTGPGHLAQVTPAAQQAISQADGVVGYSLYVDLIRPLLRPGQIISAQPITQERQRAQYAIQLAQWGLTVAVVSSGDCGIYGMAGLVLEELQHLGWDGEVPSIQVFPGITALQAAASRVGAPLMHDFCAISLSDLLTPWPLIETRLEAAAQADFVIALYNPKSKTRTTQIAIAQQILLRHRPPDTPVALVRSAYRVDEQVTLTDLATFTEQPIDMLTTILIGNTSSRRHHHWLITPRGYLGNI